MFARPSQGVTDAILEHDRQTVTGTYMMATCHDDLAMTGTIAPPPPLSEVNTDRHSPTLLPYPESQGLQTLYRINTPCSPIQPN